MFGMSGGAGPKEAKRDSSTAPNQLPAVERVAAADNPWQVPLLAVHTITQSMTSTTGNPEFATNAVSYGREDGIGFIGQAPPTMRSIPTDLRYHTDGKLVDGALFLPTAMEQKWALYFHRNQILCVRSWQRKVLVTATVQSNDGNVQITAIQGVFTDENEPQDLTIRLLDYLLRSHALEVPYPVPLLSGLDKDPGQAALWCFSLFGNKALFATTEAVPTDPPQVPLRTYSVLHIAAARGDVEGMKAILSQGVSPDLPDRDGQPPLHWALSGQELSSASYLLDYGAQVDFRDPEGATMLMQAVQQAKLSQTVFLLSRSADPNAQDSRGFTALHRAAYIGHQDLVQTLLQHGASPHIEAQGHRPRSHAQKQGHFAIVRILDSYS